MRTKSTLILVTKSNSQRRLKFQSSDFIGMFGKSSMYLVSWWRNRGSGWTNLMFHQKELSCFLVSPHWNNLIHDTFLLRQTSSVTTLVFHYSPRTGLKLKKTKKQKTHHLTLGSNMKKKTIEFANSYYSQLLAFHPELLFLGSFSFHPTTEAAQVCHYPEWWWSVNWVWLLETPQKQDYYVES